MHGFDRGVELAQAIRLGTAGVVERGGRVTGYTAQLAFFGHSTAQHNPGYASTDRFGGVLRRLGDSCAFPERRLVALWCLDLDPLVVQPITLMSTGLYNEPSGAWLPSVLF
jgi:hypothetical protein